MRESGILERFKMKYWQNFKVEMGLDGGVTLEDVQPIFICLIFGQAIALILLGIEILYARRTVHFGKRLQQTSDSSRTLSLKGYRPSSAPLQKKPNSFKNNYY